MSCMFALFCLCWKCPIGVFGVYEVKSVTEGDSVTLNSGVSEISVDEDILWKYGAETMSLVAEVSRASGIFSTYDGPNGRFRNRLKLDNKTGSLTITNITTEHDGRYEVQRNGKKWSSKTFRVTVYARLSVPVIRHFSQCPSSLQNCSVLCSVVNVSHVTLSWLKGNSLLSSISVSDLSISLSLPLEVDDQDTNNYSCVLNNSITHQTTHLDVCDLCQTCEDSPAESVSPKMLISAVVGSLLIFTTGGIFWIYRKHRKTDQKVQTNQNEITYAEPMFYKRKEKKSKGNEEDDAVYAPLAIRRS